MNAVLGETTMSQSVPIKVIEGVELIPCERSGICSVRVLNAEARYNLSWDRYVRLKAAADTIKKLVTPDAGILDVGGYDGALALFLPAYKIDLIDPATTGASLLQGPAADRSYELAAAIDVLEHVVPSDRMSALEELARMARQHVVLNYPCQSTKAAQNLVLNATNNALVREHVQWELPDTDWVLSKMAELGFRGSMVSYASVAVWLGQYLTLNLAPDAAKELNRYLIEHHADEPFSAPLYHLVVCERES